MEYYDDLLSDNSFNEEAYYSDRVDSDIENELYGLIHHDTQINAISQDKSDSVENKSFSLQNKLDSVENKSFSLQNKSDSVEIKSVSLQDKSSFAENNSILSQNNLGLTGDNSVASDDTLNPSKNRKYSVKKNNQINSPIVTNDTNFFSSDAIVNSNLYFSFESPIQKQKNQQNQVQSGNSKRNAILTPTKRKSDVVSSILGNIQSKKNFQAICPKNTASKRNKINHSSKMIEEESFVEVIEDSSDSSSNSSIMFLELDESNIETNITKETVVLSSDSEDSDSSMEKNVFQACQSKQTDVNPNNEDLWHINLEDKFRTRKQSNRYHENAIITCSKCQLKGHSAKFCSVPKEMKCFFCGDCHSGMNCKNKICTKCFQQGHDRRHCYIRYIDTCELCRMKGHSERNCPDLWRRYHLTTSKGKIVKGNPKSHSPLYCYSCGAKGHYGAECMESRKDRWSFPTWTSVISYKNPISILRRENRRNFQQEERNSHGRSRFDRTPLFHRRKGKETFLKDTPPQNAKKKKKKSPKKVSPNTKQQLTPIITNINQNEVYFPRTPKIPASSSKRFSKKKFKKLQNKDDTVLRQQVIHRIGLHQRLGLPFPSTV